MLCCGPDLPLSCNEMVLRNVQEVGEEEVLGRMAGAAQPLGLHRSVPWNLPATSPQEKGMLCCEEPGASPSPERMSSSEQRAPNFLVLPFAANGLKAMGRQCHHIPD